MDAHGDFGVYLHVPFCRKRCPYCDFALTPVSEAPSAAFTEAALSEIEREETVDGLPLAPLFAGRQAVSVYLGGGTPSMLEPPHLERLLLAIDRRFGIAPGAEVTLEANPEDVEEGRLAGWRAAGVTRLSLGVQALDDRLLRALGRAHDTAGAVASVRSAFAAGFREVSLDLIFGVEGMTVQDWRKSLARAVDLGPTHLSCYGLTVEKGTSLARAVESGGLTLPDDDAQAEMWQMAGEILGAAGLPRYEISNYGKPAVHNALYWRYAEWLGFGPSAHSAVHIPGGTLRFWRARSPLGWLAGKGSSRLSGWERVTGRAAMGEMAFTALRTVAGLEEERFARLFGTPFEEVFGGTFGRLSRLGLGVRERGRAALTERGLLLSDSIFADLVANAA